MIVVLNKTDTVDKVALTKMEKKIRITLQKFSFGSCPIVSVAACPSADENNCPVDLSKLTDVLVDSLYWPERSDAGSVSFSVNSI